MSWGSMGSFWSWVILGVGGTLGAKGPWVPLGSGGPLQVAAMGIHGSPLWTAGCVVLGPLGCQEPLDATTPLLHGQGVVIAPTAAPPAAEPALLGSTLSHPWGSPSPPTEASHPPPPLGHGGDQYIHISTLFCFYILLFQTM